MNARDRQVARETVRPRSECHHCNPGCDTPADRAPIDLGQLPPWECCGRRGDHWPSCPHDPRRQKPDAGAETEAATTKENA